MPFVKPATLERQIVQLPLCGLFPSRQNRQKEKAISSGTLAPIRSGSTGRNPPIERLLKAMLRQVWQDTDDLSTTDCRLGLLPEFYAEEIGMVFRKNLQ